MDDKLTGHDYMTRAVLELQSHPDFNPHAMRVVAYIAKMTNEQLEHIDIHAALRQAKLRKGN